MAESQVTATGLDLNMLKAIGHPIRLDTLWILGERVASPSEIGKELGLAVTTVSHHVDVLKKCGVIELVKTAPRRGATEHYYRAIAKANVTDQISALLPRVIRSEISGTILKEALRLVAEAIDADTFDSRTDRHLSWLAKELDEEGWAELVALKAQALKDEFEIVARSAERISDGARPVGKFAMVAAAFEVPDP